MCQLSNQALGEEKKNQNISNMVNYAGLCVNVWKVGCFDDKIVEIKVFRQFQYAQTLKSDWIQFIDDTSIDKVRLGLVQQSNNFIIMSFCGHPFM